jgi:hypothetical protein
METTYTYLSSKLIIKFKMHTIFQLYFTAISKWGADYWNIDHMDEIQLFQTLRVIKFCFC